MIIQITRRFTILFTALAAFLGIERKRGKANQVPTEAERIEHWYRNHDRVWIGGEFWSNPMEDWRV